MGEDPDNEPLIEHSKIRWVTWYRRMTGVGLKESLDEYDYRLSLRLQRCTEYLYSASCMPHRPHETFIQSDRNAMRECGQVYCDLINRLYEKGK